MSGMLDIQRQRFALHYRTFYSVPAGPEKPRRQPVLVKLNAHVEVVKLPHDGAARLSLLRIIEVTGVPVRYEVFEGRCLTEIQRLGKQDLSGEDSRGYLAHLRRQILATAAYLKGQHVRVADIRNP